MGTIRTLLAVAILITHSEVLFGVRLLNGDMAVTCFYIISGFLITLILNEKYTNKIKAFYTNRALRIYVPYFAALVFSIIVFAAVDNTRHDPFAVYEKAKLLGSDPWIIWSAFSSLTLIGLDLTRYIEVKDTFDIAFPNFLHGGGGGGDNLLFVPQAWTLAIELQFYLLAPFLMRKLKVVGLLLVTIGLFVTTDIIYDRLVESGVKVDVAAIFAMQLKYFLLGGLSYHAYRYLRDWTASRQVKLALSIPAWIIAFFLVYRGYSMVGTAQYGTLQYFYIGFAVTLPFIFYLTSSWHWDHRVGDYSYPIYLFHFAVVALLTNVDLGEWQGEVVLVVTVLVCTAFLYAIDRPLQRLRRRIARRSGAVGPAVLNEPETASRHPQPATQ